MMKQSKKYLDIPDNFNGFGYKELRIRRAILELKREALKQKMAQSVNGLRPDKKKQNHFAPDDKNNSKWMNFGNIVKAATLGIEAYRIINKFRNKNKVQK